MGAEIDSSQSFLRITIITKNQTERSQKPYPENPPFKAVNANQPDLTAINCLADTTT